MKFKLDLLFIKFILVGCLNTLFGYGIYSLALFIGLHYSLACILSTVLGVLFNFKTTGTLVFQNNNNKLFWKFISVYTLTTGISIICLKFLKDLNFNMYFAGFILMIFMSIITFILQKYFVFRKEEL